MGLSGRICLKAHATIAFHEPRAPYTVILRPARARITQRRGCPRIYLHHPQAYMLRRGRKRAGGVAKFLLFPKVQAMYTTHNPSTPGLNTQKAHCTAWGQRPRALPT
eukprot:2688851-Rhodomonas_salina.1